MELILKYIHDHPTPITIYTQPGCMGRLWWRTDKVPWKKSKAHEDLYPVLYYYLYDNNSYTARDITADPSPWGINSY
jgi:hypothetical protein